MFRINNRVKFSLQDFNHQTNLILSPLNYHHQQANVPRPLRQHRRPRPQLHVLRPARLLRRRRSPLEVRQRRVDPRWQARRLPSDHRLHSSRLAQLRRALDETGRQLQQSEVVE